MTLFKPKQAMARDTSPDLAFLLTERISKQWAGFLRAFSDEMQAQLSTDEYRELLRNMGLRLAESLPIEAQDTVEALESAINGHLQHMQWGYARMTDSGSMLQIEHYFDPLSSALQVDAAVSGGLLEGVYECWFRSAGADDELRVLQVPHAASPTVLEFRFGRHE